MTYLSQPENGRVYRRNSARRLARASADLVIAERKLRWTVLREIPRRLRGVWRLPSIGRYCGNAGV